MYSNGKICYKRRVNSHGKTQYTLTFVTMVIQLCSLMDELFKALSIHFSLLSHVSVINHGYWTVYIMYMGHTNNMIRYVWNHFKICLYRKLDDIQYIKIRK